MYKLVLIRHGESTWNLENRFTGWTDVELTPTGVSQAMSAGKLLKAEGYEFDVAYTSVLKRAIHTLNYALDEMDRTWLPVVKDWRLNQRQDLRYAKLKPEQVPLPECLKDTVARVVPYWTEVLAPASKSGQRIVIAAHGNSIRALVKYLDNIGDNDIVSLTIPNGIPLVYELDADLKPIKHYYLGDAEAAAAAAAAVAKQGKA